MRAFPASARLPRILLCALAAGAVAGCSGAGAPEGGGQAQAGGSNGTGGTGAAAATPAQSLDPADPFTIEQVAQFDEPWAMAFLPDGKALVTQRGGDLMLADPSGGADAVRVEGTTQVAHAGQGGLGDVVLRPNFAQDNQVYLSWAETGSGGSGAAVGRATLHTDGTPRLEGLQVIWRQEPKVDGTGHFSHRMAFSPDGRYLFVSSGDRQKMQPAQDLSNTLGTIVRLNPDGTPAQGNPFADRGGVAAQIWSYGHRNPLGLAFDAAGNLWSSEMGPQGGDEVNLIVEGANYGWPNASNGSHYGGADIPDHTASDGYEAPKVSWNPSVSPGSLMIYSGDLFAPWQGDAFIGALSGEALLRVDLDGTNATEANRWDLGSRIRDVVQGPDGALWLLTDGTDGELWRLTPKG